MFSAERGPRFEPAIQGLLVETGRQKVGAYAPHSRTKPEKKTGNRGTASQPDPGIAGGYVPIDIGALVCAWTLLERTKHGQFDLRVWLASYEVAHRRRWVPRGKGKPWEAQALASEISALSGGGERKVLESLRRLRLSALLTWGARTGPSFLSEPELLPEHRACRAREMLRLMPKRTWFPMPRRMLRVLAGGVKLSVLATTISQLIRCVHRKQKVFEGIGACPEEWVVQTFQISERSVRRARAHLRELGWLKTIETPQWYLNRFGGRFEVALDWKRPALKCRESAREVDSQELAPKGVLQPVAPVENSEVPSVSAPILAPPEPRSGVVLAPPYKKDLPTKVGIKKSDPGPAARPAKTNDFLETERELPEEPPNLRKVVMGDLGAIERVMELFNQALESPLWRKRGWTPRDTPSERLNWAAAAARAKIRGSDNPPGLFVWLVRERRWFDVNCQDEDSVRVGFAEWQAGVDQGAFAREERGGEFLTQELSEDAKFVKGLRLELAKKGFLDDAFPHVHRARPEWTRERWDRALRELKLVA